jgi:hypothetical protein
MHFQLAFCGKTKKTEFEREGDLLSMTFLLVAAGSQPVRRNDRR